MYRSSLAAAFVALFVIGCVSHEPAPVIDKSQQSEHAFQDSVRRVCQANPPMEFCHVVQRGDTLYSISRMHGLKVVEVASRNSIQAPFVIRPGDLLVVRNGNPRQAQPIVRAQPQQVETPRVNRLQRVVQQQRPRPTRTASRPSAQQPIKPTVTSKPKSPPKVAVAPAVKNVKPKVAAKPKPKPSSPPQTVKAKPGWQWPVPFTPLASSDKTALNYQLSDGTEVVAASSGRVIYAGAGLNKYKHLIIIDSGKSHLVAYEFNTPHGIEEQERVQRGDRITRITGGSAEGEEAQRQRQFRFEIWSNGKPLNPKTVIATAQRR